MQLPMHQYKCTESQVVLQVIVFVKQHLHPPAEWLACMHKVRMKTQLVLHCWVHGANNAFLSVYVNLLFKLVACSTFRRTPCAA